MPVLFLSESFSLTGWLIQLLWVFAIVATILLFLLLLLTWFGLHQEKSQETGIFRVLTDPLAVLVFMTFLGWTSVLASLWIRRLDLILGYAVIASMIAAFLPRLLLALRKKNLRKNLPDPKLLIKSTGEVLQNIPPHQVGRGRVHLSLRATPHDWEAVTVGGELPKGIHVRVVDVLDDHTVLVEPLDLPHAPATLLSPNIQGPAGEGAVPGKE